MPRRALALAALSGLLLAASFPSVGLFFLAWIALVPLFIALRDRTPREGLALAGVFSLVFFCGTVYWVTNSIHFYGHVALLPAVLIMLLFCVILALFIVPFGAAAVLIRQRRPGLFFLAAPVLWVALELGRTHLFTGFPWALLGYSQYRVLPLIQVADLTGVYGVSFLIALVNAAAAELVGDRRKRIVPALAAVAALGVVLGYGALKLREAPAGGSVRIAVVQGNIEQDRKWDKAYQNEVIRTYERLTTAATAQRPDLVLWPETATPFYFGASGESNDAAMTRDLRQFVRGTGTPLLTGSPYYERKPDRSYLLRNSAYLLDRNGETAGVYHKIHLVPFGEYVPLKNSLLFFVEKIVQAIGDFQGGTEHTVMRVPTAGNGETTLGTVICYEVIFPDLVRRFVDRGAAVMTTITNDAWFGRTSAPYQHFSMTVLRAVENRVPFARAANTGISGFIDSQGRILETTGLFTEAVLVRDLVPRSGPKTFYTRHGDVFAWLCVLASVALLILPKKAARSNGTGSLP